MFFRDDLVVHQDESMTVGGRVVDDARANGTKPPGTPRVVVQYKAMSRAPLCIFHPVYGPAVSIAITIDGKNVRVDQDTGVLHGIQTNGRVIAMYTRMAYPHIAFDMETPGRLLTSEPLSFYNSTCLSAAASIPTLFYGDELYDPCPPRTQLKDAERAMNAATKTNGLPDREQKVSAMVVNVRAGKYVGVSLDILKCHDILNPATESVFTNCPDTDFHRALVAQRRLGSNESGTPPTVPMLIERGYAYDTPLIVTALGELAHDAGVPVTDARAGLLFQLWTPYGPGTVDMEVLNTTPAKHLGWHPIYLLYDRRQAVGPDDIERVFGERYYFERPYVKIFPDRPRSFENCMGTVVPGDYPLLLPRPERTLRRDCVVAFKNIYGGRTLRVRRLVVPKSPSSCRGFVASLNASNALATVSPGVVMGTGEIVSGVNTGKGMGGQRFTSLAQSHAQTDGVSVTQTTRVTHRESKSEARKQRKSTTVREEHRNADGSARIRSVQKSDEQSHETTWTREVVIELISHVCSTTITSRYLELVTRRGAATGLATHVSDLSAPVGFGIWAGKHASSWFARAASVKKWPILAPGADIHDLFDHVVDCWSICTAIWIEAGREDGRHKEVVTSSKKTATALGLRWTNRMHGEFAMTPLLNDYLLQYLYPREECKTKNPDMGALLDCTHYFDQLHAWEFASFGRGEVRPLYWDLVVDIGRRHRQKTLLSTLQFPITDEQPGWLGIAVVAKRAHTLEHAAVSDEVKTRSIKALGAHVPKSTVVDMVSEFMKQRF
jgi:hypothetical protein